MAQPRLMKHNPDFMTDTELDQGFVVRQQELEILADVVRANVGEVNQHALVIGPRGMGKTMLLRRLALLVRNDEALREFWYPIVAPEEIYDAANEGELWLAILQQLAEQLRQEGGDFERWYQRYETLHRELDEDRLRTLTLGALVEFSREQGKRLLVLIENLQMLLGEQFGKDADWDLRKTLLNRPEIMLVLTATTRFEQIQKANFAAFELFRELELRPLSTDACRQLWQAVSGQLLENQKIRPMEILTGGNPRLLSILATFAPERPLKELLDHLAELIDEHTPFLKHNIEALPAQERRVFVNLARLWEPSTARQVGGRSRIASNTASAVLKSLVNRGAVVEIGKEGRGKLYQVAERIYCIYYLMRLSGSDADRVRAFVRFMVPLYGEDGLARSLAEAACGVEGVERRLFIEGFRELLPEDAPGEVWRRILQATPGAFLELPEVREWLAKLPMAGSTAKPLGKDVKEVISDIFIEAQELDQAGQFEGALQVYDEVIKQCVSLDDPAFHVPMAAALLRKGYALKDRDHYEEAIRAYNGAIERCADSDDPVLRAILAVALVNKSTATMKIGRHEEAIRASSEVVGRFADSEEAILSAAVTAAFANLGTALRRAERYIEAIQALEKVLPRLAPSDDPSLRIFVARELCRIGASFVTNELPEQAIQVFDKVVRLFADSDDPELQVEVGKALFIKGMVLGVAKRYEESIEVLDKFTEGFAKTDDPTLRDWIATALDLKGSFYADNDQHEQAIKAYAELAERFADSDDPELRTRVVQALLRKGIILHDSERFEEAIRAYYEIVERFGNSEDPELRGLVAQALNNKASDLYTTDIGRLQEAIEAGEKAVNLAPQESHYRHTLASVYGLAGRWDEAFPQIAVVLKDESFIQKHLDDHLAFFIDAAADGQAERALEILAGTAAEKAMEPLVVALKQLAGQKYRAPQEVEEVAKDVLAKIETRREELKERRAQFEVAAPH